MFIKSLLAIAVLGAATVEPVKLARTYAENQTKTYAVWAENKEREFSFTGDLTFKVAGKAKDNLTPLKVTCPSARVTVQGNIAEDEAIDTTLNYDSHGLPVDMTVDGSMMAVAVTNLSGYVPGTDVEVGKAFDIKWEQGGNVFKGKGTLEKVEDKDGKKVATVKIEADFTPSSGETAKLDVTTEIDLADGTTIGSKGKIAVSDEGTFEFTIKPKV